MHKGDDDDSGEVRACVFIGASLDSPLPLLYEEWRVYWPAGPPSVNLFV